jgi:hypothetical protein
MLITGHAFFLLSFDINMTQEKYEWVELWSFGDLIGCKPGILLTYGRGKYRYHQY